MPPGMEARILNHGITREVPHPVCNLEGPNEKLSSAGFRNGNEDARKIQACYLPAPAQCLLGLEASPGQDGA